MLQDGNTNLYKEIKRIKTGVMKMFYIRYGNGCPTLTLLKKTWVVCFKQFFGESIIWNKLLVKELSQKEHRAQIMKYYT